MKIYLIIQIQHTFFYSGRLYGLVTDFVWLVVRFAYCSPMRPCCSPKQPGLSVPIPPELIIDITFCFGAYRRSMLRLYSNKQSRYGISSSIPAAWLYSVANQKIFIALAGQLSQEQKAAPFVEREIAPSGLRDSFYFFSDLIICLQIC